MKASGIVVENMVYWEKVEFDVPVHFGSKASFFLVFLLEGTFFSNKHLAFPKIIVTLESANAWLSCLLQILFQPCDSLNGFLPLPMSTFF